MESRYCHYHYVTDNFIISAAVFPSPGAVRSSENWVLLVCVITVGRRLHAFLHAHSHGRK